MACKDRVRYVSGIPVRAVAGPKDRLSGGTYPKGARSLWVIGDDGAPRRVGAKTPLGKYTVSVLVCPPDFTPTAADFADPPEGSWLGKTSDKTSWGNAGRRDELTLPDDSQQLAAMRDTAGENIIDTPKVRYQPLREKLLALGVPIPERSSYQFSPVTEQLMRTASAHLEKGFDVPYIAYLDGPPGTGKTYLAEAIAAELGGEVFEYRCLSDSEIMGLHGLLFAFDPHGAVLHEGAIARAPAWHAFMRTHSEGPAVLLIDEIDKAPTEFVDDLLRLVETGEFEVPSESPSLAQLGVDPDGKIAAAFGNLIVVMTSNDTKPIGPAFQSRRTQPYHLPYPNRKELKARAMATLTKGLTEEEAGEEVRPAQVDVAVRMVYYLRDYVMTHPEVVGDPNAVSRAESYLPTVREVTHLCRNLTNLADQDTESTKVLTPEGAAVMIAGLYLKDGLPGVPKGLSTEEQIALLDTIFATAESRKSAANQGRNAGSTSAAAVTAATAVSEAVAQSAGKGSKKQGRKSGLWRAIVTDSHKTLAAIGPKA